MRERVPDAFVETYQVKYEKAADCLTKDRDALLAFYDFPAEPRTMGPVDTTAYVGFGSSTAVLARQRRGR